jgi:hypothetical protein
MGWENMYFCSVVRGKIVCLICGKAVSAPKEYTAPSLLIFT